MIKDSRDIFWEAGLNELSMRANQVDLKAIHDLCANLPISTEAPNEAVAETLDLLSAAIFHVLFPMRKAFAEAWFDEHPLIVTKRTKKIHVLSPELESVRAALIERGLRRI